MSVQITVGGVSMTVEPDRVEALVLRDGRWTPLPLCEEAQRRVRACVEIVAFEVARFPKPGQLPVAPPR